MKTKRVNFFGNTVYIIIIIIIIIIITNIMIINCTRGTHKTESTIY